jgi:hypothetical protein
VIIAVSPSGKNHEIVYNLRSVQVAEGVIPGPQSGGRPAGTKDPGGPASVLRQFSPGFASLSTYIVSPSFTILAGWSRHFGAPSSVKPQKEPAVAKTAPLRESSSTTWLFSPEVIQR